MPTFTEANELVSVTVLPSGHLEVKRADRVRKDGVVVGEVFHRHVVSPGADTDDELPLVQDVAAAVWTTALIDAETDRVAAAKAAKS